MFFILYNEYIYKSYSNLVIMDLLIQKNGPEGPSLICTHFPGHILFTSLNTWMLPCISQGASILFLLESFCYCNS